MGVFVQIIITVAPDVSGCVDELKYSKLISLLKRVSAFPVVTQSVIGGIKSSKGEIQKMLWYFLQLAKQNMNVVLS